MRDAVPVVVADHSAHCACPSSSVNGWSALNSLPKPRDERRLIGQPGQDRPERTAKQLLGGPQAGPVQDHTPVADHRALQLEWQLALQISCQQFGGHRGAHVVRDQHHRTRRRLRHHGRHDVGLFEQAVAVWTRLVRQPEAEEVQRHPRPAVQMPHQPGGSRTSWTGSRATAGSSGRRRAPSGRTPDQRACPSACRRRATLPRWGVTRDEPYQHRGKGQKLQGEFTPDPALYPFTSRWFDSSRGRVHYIDEGTGPVIVFFHGNPTWSFLYRNIIAGLRDRFRCIAPDYLGFGLSERPSGFTYRIEEHAAVMGELVDHLELEQYLSMGQDWGGPISMAVGTERAERVRGVVLGNTWFWPTAELVHQDVQHGDGQPADAVGDHKAELLRRAPDSGRHSHITGRRGDGALSRSPADCRRPVPGWRACRRRFLRPVHFSNGSPATCPRSSDRNRRCSSGA